MRSNRTYAERPPGRDDLCRAVGVATRTALFLATHAKSLRELLPPEDAASWARVFGSYPPSAGPSTCVGRCAGEIPGRWAHFPGVR